MESKKTDIDWPWNSTTRNWPDKRADGSPWPKISVVVPSYNQADFIEETLLSIINQNYPDLELIVIDGGSSDGSVEIIKKYENIISYWVSEKDRGQSHAINKGFEKAKGEWIAWMNSDDCYLVNSFWKIFSNADLNGVDFIYGNTGYMGESLNKSYLFQARKIDPLNSNKLARFFYGVDYIIPSQSVFVSKKILKNVGLLDEKLNYCMDLDWFIRIAKNKPKYICNQFPTYFYRLGNHTKTGTQNEKMYAEAKLVALSHVRNKNERAAIEMLIDYSDNLKKLHKNKDEKIPLWDLLLLGWRRPSLAFTDRRFLGLLKRNIL